MPATLFVSFSVFLASLWVLAGQLIGHLLDFYWYSIQFALSYQESVNVISTQSEYVFAFITISIIAGTVITRLIKAALVGKAILLKEIFYSIIFGSCLFVSWKHGMISRNIHLGIYFNYIACVAPFLFFHRVDELKLETPIFGKEKNRFNILPSMNLCFAVFSAVIFLFFLLNPVFLRTQPFNVYSEMVDRLDTLWNYNFIMKKKELDQDIATLIKDNQIPERIKQYMGNARVDEYGYEPQILLINKLNYHPRPIPINFVAVGSSLKELNKQFYSNTETAPKYIFTSVSGGLFHSQPAMQVNDSGAFIELLHNYWPIDEYKKWLILRRQSVPRTIKYVFIGSKSAVFNQNIDMPYDGKGLVWCKINIRYNCIGRLMKIFFKPAKIAIEYYDADNFRYEQTIIPMSTEYGFLINPLIKGFL